MNKPPPKPDIGFQEALRRIAKTPKSLVVSEDDQKQDASDKRAKDQDKKKPHPLSRRGAVKVS